MSKIRLSDYQSDAVEELLSKSMDALLGEGEADLVLQAPTGSGKTVIATSFLEKLAAQNAAQCLFLWVAPNKLHKQTEEKMAENLSSENLFVVGEDAWKDSFDRNEVVLFNWASVNSKKNRARSSGEAHLSLPQIIENSRKKGLKTVLFVDESHTGIEKKAQEFLDEFVSDLRINISATPNKVEGEKLVAVSPKRVRKSGFIKDKIIMNPKSALAEAQDKESEGGDQITYEEMLSTAVSLQRELRDLYLKEGSKINPLILVQVPSGDAGEEMISIVAAALEGFNISEARGNLARWMSDSKPEDTNEVYKLNGAVDVLLFKQGIAVGWDCPRAQILVKLRQASKNEKFDIQTVGRITRMPELKHYKNPKLNNGYVFHADTEYKADWGIASEITTAEAEIKPGVEASLPPLPAAFYKRVNVDPPSGSEVKEALTQFIETFSGRYVSRGTENSPEAQKQFIRSLEAKGIVTNLEKATPSSEKITIGDELQDGELQTSMSYALWQKTANENSRLIREIVRNILKTEKRVKTVYEGLLRQLSDNSGYDFTEVKSMLSAKENIDIFTDALKSSFEDVAPLYKRQERVKVNYLWKIPEIEYKNTKISKAGKDLEIHEEQSADYYSHEPCYLLKSKEKRSENTEVLFEEFLESNAKEMGLKWWWKNGDLPPQGSEIDDGEELRVNFSITCQDEDGRHNFLPDYITLAEKNGEKVLYIIETKGWYSAFSDEKKNQWGRITQRAVNIAKLQALEEWTDARKKDLKGIRVVSGILAYKDGEGKLLSSVKDLKSEWQDIDDEHLLDNSILKD